MTIHKLTETGHVQFTKLARFALGTMDLDEQEDVLHRIDHEKNKWFSTTNAERYEEKVEAFSYKYVFVVLKFEQNKIVVFDVVNRNFFNIKNYTPQYEII